MRLERANGDRLRFTVFDKVTHCRVSINHRRDGVRGPAFQKNIAGRDLFGAAELERLVGGGYLSPR